MKYVAAVIIAGILAGCGEVPTVYREQPATSLISGVWTGTEEITTDNDITSNVNYPGTTAGGFSFPVVVQFGSDGRFSLVTANFPTSYRYDEDRSCSGVYTRTSSSITLVPTALCRALPMSKYTIGRTLYNGMTLEARTNTSGDPMANYASVHVMFNLQKN